MKVKVKEVARKKGWFKVVGSGLGIAVFAEYDIDVPSTLVGAITRPILKWRKKRGEKAYALSLTFTAEEEMHQAIEVALFRLYRDDGVLQRVLDRMNSINVTLCNEDGVPSRTYALDMVALLSGRYHRVAGSVEDWINNDDEKRLKRRRKKVQVSQDEDEEDEVEEEDEEDDDEDDDDDDDEEDDDDDDEVDEEEDED